MLMEYRDRPEETVTPEHLDKAESSDHTEETKVEDDKDEDE